MLIQKKIICSDISVNRNVTYIYNIKKTHHFYNSSSLKLHYQYNKTF